jgi:hypothetical protein
MHLKGTKLTLDAGNPTGEHACNLYVLEDRVQ